MKHHWTEAAFIPDVADADRAWALEPAMAQLALPFVTADLVRRTDGAWRLVEIGDGQVSDRPSSTTPEALLAACLATAPTAPREA